MHAKITERSLIHDAISLSSPIRSDCANGTVIRTGGRKEKSY